MFNSQELSQNFSFDSVFDCPVCMNGKITVMPLMEAFSCDFCRHIFTADFKLQSLQMADNSAPITWYWNGKTWRGANRHGAELSWGVAVGAIALVVLPTSLVALSVYIFPPVSGSRLSWLPTVWMGLTFITHCWFVISIIFEYYQMPILAYWQAIQRNLLRQFYE